MGSQATLQLYFQNPYISGGLGHPGLSSLHPRGSCCAFNGSQSVVQCPLTGKAKPHHHIEFCSTLRPTSEFSLPDSRQSTFVSQISTSVQRRRQGLMWRNENTHVTFMVSQAVVHTTLTVVKQLVFDHKIQQGPRVLKVQAS